MFHDHHDSIGGPHYDAGLFLISGHLTRFHKGGAEKKAGIQKLGAVVVEADRRKRAGQTGGTIDANSLSPPPAPNAPLRGAPPAAAPASAAPDNSAPVEQKKKRPYRGTLFTGGDYREPTSLGGGSTLLG